MRLPALTDYVQAVQHPALAFTDEKLRRGMARCTPLGTPAVASGGFALTFDITVAGERYAVRCFHKEGNHLQERYTRVSEFIRAHSRYDFLVDVAFIPRGVRVNGDDFPIVRMPWIAGATLSDWVEANLRSPDELRKVQQRIHEAVGALQQTDAAHGDLQHGNILVRPDRSVQLVDYDGMFLPALSALGAAERGHRHYQHPARGDAYDSKIDAFSAAVLDLSLSALQHEPRLWDEFHNGENLIFTAADFADPAASAVFDRTERIPPLQESTRRLRAACTADFAAVPEALQGDDRVRTTSAPPRPRRRGPQPVHAIDANALRSAEGDEKTVFGRVHNVVGHPRGPAMQTANINFGDYKRGAFTIYVFGDAIGELQRRFGSDLAGLNGTWLCLTGLITLFKSRTAKVAAPQIHLRKSRPLQVLSAEQVAALLRPPPEEDDTTAHSDTRESTGPGAPAAERRPGDPSPPSATPRPSSGGTRAVEDRLSSLYSSQGFGSTVKPSGPRSPNGGAVAGTPPALRAPAPPPPVPPKHRFEFLTPPPQVTPPSASSPPPPPPDPQRPKSKLGSLWDRLTGRR
ncbi:hypothetical protein ABZ805_11295 [Saccharopolyspora sp. NPDC047091]|uniref:hypothetical protein n=1 Tax=Saccharopolyspora sp. NPDC047091 TaxID=3155924 RepID=UPI0033D79E49